LLKNSADRSLGERNAPLREIGLKFGGPPSLNFAYASAFRPIFVLPRPSPERGDFFNRIGHKLPLRGTRGYIRFFRETLIYCASRPGHGWPGIFDGCKPLKMERFGSRASRIAS
jgi:hypothetical protein